MAFLSTQCSLCPKTFSDNRTLSIHVTTGHKLDKKIYYDRYLQKKDDGVCIDCKIGTDFRCLGEGYNLRCPKCKRKHTSWSGWQNNPIRKKKAQEQFKSYANRNGRPKGSRNVNPYPQTEAVHRRFKLTAYKQGFFKPKNPQKYNGNPSMIVYRSQWELGYMMKLDHNPSVTKWSSEEIKIGYISPKDGLPHLYHPDFFVETKDKKMIVEIKPSSQVVIPKKTGKKTDRRLMVELITYAINDAKWAAAKTYCDKRGWKFVILTEVELGLVKKKIVAKS